MPNRQSEYKDFQKARETHHKQKRKYYGKTSYAKNYRKEWTGEEEQMVIKHDIPDVQLSNLIGRSVKSIQVRRVLILKRCNEEQPMNNDKTPQ